MKWKNIIKSEEERQEILEIIDKISKAILIHKPLFDSKPGLILGKAGVTLFLFYYAKYINNQKIHDFATELLESVLIDINDGFSYHTHANGISGVGFVINLLTQEDFIEINTEEVLEIIDEYLYPLMIAELRNKNYDFLHGASGIALYYINRFPNINTKQYLTDFVNELDNIAQKNKDGIRWISVINEETKAKGINLGLSHGLASIVVTLSKLYAIGIEKPKVKQLINGTVKYLMNQQLDSEATNSIFPSWICETESSNSSRLAWCHGDLGIGITIWQAGVNLNNEKWKNYASEILMHSLKRKDLKKNSVHDACLCHGTSGIGHIFNRMYHYTNKPEFKVTANYWMDETIKFSKHSNGLAGFLNSSKNLQGESTPADYGFLSGISGIGLSLLASVSDIEPIWDETLLLS